MPRGGGAPCPPLRGGPARGPPGAHAPPPLPRGGRAPPPAGQDTSRPLTEGDNAETADAAGSTAGAAPQMEHLRLVVALIWRSVVLWMLLLALLSLANLIG